MLLQMVVAKEPVNQCSALSRSQLSEGKRRSDFPQHGISMGLSVGNTIPAASDDTCTLFCPPRTTFCAFVLDHMTSYLSWVASAGEKLRNLRTFPLHFVAFNAYVSLVEYSEEAAS